MKRVRKTRMKEDLGFSVWPKVCALGSALAVRYIGESVAFVGEFFACIHLSATFSCLMTPLTSHL
jgi:hypothetical protein